MAVSELTRARGKRSSGTAKKLLLATALTAGCGLGSSSVLAATITDGTTPDSSFTGINESVTGSESITVDISKDVTPDGILAFSESGAITIKTEGDVTSETEPDGIHAESLFGNVTVNQAEGSTINGIDDGIEASSYSGDQVSVNVAGTINADYGIYAHSDGSANIIVDQAVTGEINANYDGIYADSDSGDVTVNANGSIEAGWDGITAESYEGSVTVNQEATGEIKASYDGIDVYSEFGDVTVNANGSIEAGWDGIYAESYKGDNVIVNVSGLIKAGDDGVDTYAPYDANITVNQLAGSSIEAGYNGIYAYSDTGDVTINQEAGSVIESDSDGIYAESYYGRNLDVKVAGNITSGGDGVYADGGYVGDVLVTQAASSSIQASGDGIEATSDDGSLTLDLAGGIKAGEYGVYAYSDAADITINQAATSTIEGFYEGVDAYTYTGDITLNLAGQIKAGQQDSYGGYGVYASTDYGKLTINQAVGSVIDSTYEGIYAYNYTGDIELNLAGQIKAGQQDSYGYGVDAYNDYGSILINQTADSTIDSSGVGIYAINDYGNKVTINTAGRVTATEDAIFAAADLGVSINNTGTIESTSGNAINLSGLTYNDYYEGYYNNYNVGNNTIINSGHIIAADGQAAILGGYQKDTVTSNGGSIVGGIAVGAGADTVTLNAPTNVSQLTYLNGDAGYGFGPQMMGAEVDTLNLGVDITGSSSYGLMTINGQETLLPSLGTAGNVAIDNWEYINVLNGGTLRLSGDLWVPYSAENALDTYSLTIQRGGTLALAQGVTSATIFSDVDNHGTIDLHSGDANPSNTLTIMGKYTAGSDLVVDVNLATGESDLLEIQGPVTGTTHVISNLGDVTATDNLVEVTTVSVADSSGGGTFVGTGITSNAGEGQLILTSAEGEPQTYGWTLNALNAEGTPIYKAEVSGYTQMPYANTLLGYDMLGTLHDRVGEQQTWAWDKCGECQETQGNQVWARVRGGNTELTGDNRLDMDIDNFVAQVGYDFAVNYNPENGSRRHTGFMLGYGQSKIDFFDQYRAENAQIVADKFTGEGTTDAASLGLYSTYYDKNGSYLDLTGQVSYLQNEYESRNNRDVDQDGWGAGLSAEVGRPYKLGNSHWLIEPQAQLSYQFVSLEDFNDGIAHVDQDDQHSLRGRIGTRLAYNAPTADYHTKTFYAVANVLSDFIEPADVKIGRDKLNEDYSRTWGEVGLGMQLPIATSAYVYADARYQQELSGEDRNGYTGTIGLKHSW